VRLKCGLIRDLCDDKIIGLCLLGSELSKAKEKLNDERLES